jgi:hypothetical protein
MRIPYCTICENTIGSNQSIHPTSVSSMKTRDHIITVVITVVISLLVIIFLGGIRIGCGARTAQQPCRSHQQLQSVLVREETTPRSHESTGPIVDNLPDQVFRLNGELHGAPDSSSVDRVTMGAVEVTKHMSGYETPEVTTKSQAIHSM